MVNNNCFFLLASVHSSSISNQILDLIKWLPVPLSMYLTSHDFDLGSVLFTEICISVVCKLSDCMASISTPSFPSIPMLTHVVQPVNCMVYFK